MFFGEDKKDIMYKDMILSPSDRRRGESRTNYVKEVLELTKLVENTADKDKHNKKGKASSKSKKNWKKKQV